MYYSHYARKNYLPIIDTRYVTSKEIDFSNILNELMKTAKEDGKVTKEEEDFIETLKKNVEQYEKALTIADQDKIITDDDFHEFVVLRDKILMDAMEFQSDSEDLNKLTNQLFNMVDAQLLPGMLDDDIKEDS